MPSRYSVTAEPLPPPLEARRRAPQTALPPADQAPADGPEDPRVGRRLPPATRPLADAGRRRGPRRADADVGRRGRRPARGDARPARRQFPVPAAGPGARAPAPPADAPADGQPDLALGRRPPPADGGMAGPPHRGR